MKNLRHKTRLLCLLITILTINFGCAHLLPPLSEEVSANLGTIGVYTSSHNAYLYFPKKPVTNRGEGCQRWVKSATAWLSNPGSYGGDPRGLILLPIIIPIYIIIAVPPACIAGALSTESESEVQEAEALLRNAFGELNIKEILQYRFLRVAQEKTPYNFVVLENIEFDDIKKNLNYSSLANKGVDTVVWIDISRIGLTGSTSGMDPPLRFSMSFSIELIRPTDGEVVYRHIWEKMGDNDEFVDWADNNAKLFRKELNQSIKSVAGQIAEDLFLPRP